MDSSSFFVSLVSGACAGTITDVAFFPIDTLKTRLQAKGGFFKNGGWSGVYRGLGSAVVASAPSASLFFVTYDSMKVYFKPIANEFTSNDSIGSVVTHMFSASAGEVTACLVRVPAEVIKQRTQTSSSSSLSILKSILSNEKKEGVIRGLYRGWNTTIMREIPFTVIQYPLYEYMKFKWAESNSEKKVSPIKGALCGSIAGGVAAAITTPLDVLKTRIMLHHERISIFKLTRSMINEEGYRVFLNGIGPRTMWISAGGAIFLGAYETAHSILDKRNLLD